MNNNVNIFDEYAEKYDKWYDRNRFAYFSEVEALKKVVPKRGRGLEIGVGTGRFARPLKIKYGIEPSIKMLGFARKRGIKAFKGYGEKLPFGNKQFSFVLIMITLCFVKNYEKVIIEAKRILKNCGRIIIGIVDRNSLLGKFYKKRKDSPFYKHARFFTPTEIFLLLKNNGFRNIKTFQTLFKKPDELKSVDRITRGYGKGSFVVICGEKPI